MIKKLYILPFVLGLFAILGTFSAYGQKPFIKTVRPAFASSGQTVTITGDNFGDDVTNLKVFFGAAQGTILTVSPQVLEVSVPSGATFDFVSVLNTTSGLYAYHKDHFVPSYGGEHPFDPSKINAQVDFQATNGLYDICTCDFDGDGKVDIATASQEANSVNIFRNTSSGPGNTNFAATTISLGTGTLYTTCGDLNGDGKPELVLAESGNGGRIFVYRNTSSAGSISFSSTFVAISGFNQTGRLKIADLDLDGKPEIIATDRGNEKLYVIVNQSTTSTLSFSATKLSYTVADPGVSTGDLDVGDLNADGLPDIALVPFPGGSSHLFFIRNQSTPGSIQLASAQKLTVSGSYVPVRLADINGDGKKDILSVNFIASRLHVYLNQSSTGGALTFPTAPINWNISASSVNLASGYGLEIGDMDGDGLVDAIITGIANTSIFVANNQSSLSTVEFVITTIPTTYHNRHMKIADIDSDGKPDIVSTSIDFGGTSVSKVSVLLNKNCLVPTITPEGPESICLGNSLTLSANYSQGTTYTWENEGGVVATGPQANYEVLTSGKYWVTATSTGCTKLSNEVTVTIEPGVLTGTLTAGTTSSGLVCIGSTLQLTANDVGATSYRWTGPNGFTSNTQNPTVANFQDINVGRYTVEALAGTCVAQTSSVVVESIDVANVSITSSGSNVICEGDTKILAASPDLPGFSFEWFRNNVSMGGGSTYGATTTGNYTVQGSYPGCGTQSSQVVSITVAEFPEASFTVDATEGCAGQEISFTSTSTFDTTPFYTWDFGDGQSSTQQNPKHIYNTANNYNVKLAVSYQDGACSHESSIQSINIVSAAVPSIVSSSGEFIFCEGGSVALEVVGGAYLSYTWSTGETTSTATASEEGEISVTVETDECFLKATANLSIRSAPPVIINADRNLINEGESVVLTASGINTYSWSPDDGSLSSINVQSPTASPSSSTTYSVTGVGDNGCEGSGSFTLEVVGEPIANKLSPKPYFTPNEGDEINPSWVIDQILDYPQCNVAIFDEKGVKVYESKPYLNDWDGTYKGQKLPNGTYFYIIKCDGEENKPKAGSITLLR